MGHIAEAIARATSYLQTVQDIEAFEKNPQIQDAVVRNIEVIGEAVGRIARTALGFIEQHPQIPWAQMRGMRNIIAHAYFAVDWKVVWTTVKIDLPRLREQIDHLLHRLPREPKPNRSL